MGRLDGKVALITGTAGGQGRAAALLFASEGAKVVGCDVDVAGAEETVRMVRAEGGSMTSMAPVDLSSADEAAQWVEQAVAVHGGADILYNNAARARVGPMAGLSLEAWRFTVSNDLDPVFLVTRAAWPHLVARGGGSIINTASIMAGRADDMPMGAHGAAKAGVVGLTVHLAVEGGPHGIRVNALSPGLIATPGLAGHLKDPFDGMHRHVRASPLGRVGLAEDIAPVALFLASEDARFITGANIVVDGGQSLGIGMQFGRDPRPGAEPEFSGPSGELRRIETRDGVADAWLFHPAGAGPWPGVLLYTDIMGVRPVFRVMAQRLADAGFAVLLPNLFYRSGPPLDPPLSVHRSGDFSRLMVLAGKLGRAEIERDSEAYLAALRRGPGVSDGPIACVGYCMSGAMAIWTASANPPGSVGAVAAFHGGHLTAGGDDSAVAIAGRTKARFYFGMAETDAFMTPPMIEQLRQTLDAAGADYAAEVYPGAFHGFTIPDASYHEPSAERHWTQLTSFLKQSIGEGARHG